MSDTAITPAAVFQIRAELEQLRAKVNALDERVRHLDGVDSAINELDDRVDESERRHDAAELTIRELGSAMQRMVNGVTSRDLAIERVERHMLAIMEHLQVKVTVSVAASVTP